MSQEAAARPRRVAWRSVPDATARELVVRGHGGLRRDRRCASRRRLAARCATSSRCTGRATRRATEHASAGYHRIARRNASSYGGRSLGSRTPRFRLAQRTSRHGGCQTHWRAERDGTSHAAKHTGHGARDLRSGDALPRFSPSLSRSRPLWCRVRRWPTTRSSPRTSSPARTRGSWTTGDRRRQPDQGLRVGDERQQGRQHQLLRLCEPGPDLHGGRLPDGLVPGAGWSTACSTSARSTEPSNRPARWSPRPGLIACNWRRAYVLADPGDLDDRHLRGGPQKRSRLLKRDHLRGP